MDDSTLANVLGTDIGSTTIGGLLETVTTAVTGSTSGGSETVVYAESSTPSWMPYAVVAGLVLGFIAVVRK